MKIFKGKKEKLEKTLSNPLLQEQALARRKPAKKIVERGPDAAREAQWQPPLQRHIKPDDGSEFVTIRVRILNGDAEHDFNAKFPYGPLLCSKVTNIIADKESLDAEARQLFSLWVVGKDIELQVRPDLDIFTIMNKWNTLVLDCTHYPEAIDPTHPINRHWFVYRREATVLKDVERCCTDPAAVRLLYGEAKRNVMTGRYVCVLADGVALGGMMLAMAAGPFDRLRHADGYLTKNEYWKTLIPMRLHDDLRPQEWEECLKTEHMKHDGRSPDVLRIMYLEYVREFACYGCSFFPCCRDRPPAGFFEFRLQRWLIGVSTDGVVAIDQDKNGYAFAEQWANLTVKRSVDRIILRWRDGDKGKQKKLKLFTPQAEMICNLALRAKYLALKAQHEAEQGPQQSIGHPPMPALGISHSATTASKPISHALQEGTVPAQYDAGWYPSQHEVPPSMNDAYQNKRQSHHAALMNPSQGQGYSGDHYQDTRQSSYGGFVNPAQNQPGDPYQDKRQSNYGGFINPAQNFAGESYSDKRQSSHVGLASSSQNNMARQAGPSPAEAAAFRSYRQSAVSQVGGAEYEQDKMFTPASQSGQQNYPQEYGQSTFPQEYAQVESRSRRTSLQLSEPFADRGKAVGPGQAVNEELYGRFKQGNVQASNSAYNRYSQQQAPPQADVASQPQGYSQRSASQQWENDSSLDEVGQMLSHALSDLEPSQASVSTPSAPPMDIFNESRKTINGTSNLPGLSSGRPLSMTNAGAAGAARPPLSSFIRRPNSPGPNTAAASTGISSPAQALYGGGANSLGAFSSTAAKRLSVGSQLSGLAGPPLASVPIPSLGLTPAHRRPSGLPATDASKTISEMGAYNTPHYAVTSEGNKGTSEVPRQVDGSLRPSATFGVAAGGDISQSPSFQYQRPSITATTGGRSRSASIVSAIAGAFKDTGVRRGADAAPDFAAALNHYL